MRREIRKRLLSAVVTFFICILCACGRWPVDPNHTLEKIQNSKTIRIGVIDNPPWSTYKNQKYRGIEVALVKKFSSDLGVTPIWFPFSEAKGVAALKNGQIDMLIGGLNQSSPWRKDIGIIGYFDAEYYIARPDNQPKRPLKNLPVATRKMSFLIPLLEKKSAIPIPMKNPFIYEGEIAAGRWEFDTTKYSLDEKIYQEIHVIAFPAGENLFMITLERFLEKKRPEMNKLLMKEAADENRS